MDEIPRILSYERPDASQSAATPRRWRIFLLATLLPGLIAIVAPFTVGVSPLVVLRETYTIFRSLKPNETDFTIWLMAAPFAIPLVAMILHAIALMRRRMPANYRLVEYIGCGFGTAIVLCLIVQMHVSTFGERLISLTPLPVLVFGILLFLRMRSKQIQPDLRSAVLLLTPYLANSTLLLIGFFEEREIGWYFTLCSAVLIMIFFLALAINWKSAPG